MLLRTPEHFFGGLFDSTQAGIGSICNTVKEARILETLATIAMLGASVPAAIWVGAKVFHTGVLMYGKGPALREVLRWIRQS